MTIAELKSALLSAAERNIQQGPGYAQESVVLRDTAERLRIAGDKGAEQDLLTAWHDLFLERKLSWGYDIDNPGTPFFHRVRGV